METFEALSKVIHKRQSIFPVSFNGDTISQEVIMDILKNANQAPTHKNSEPWRFHVVSGNQKESFADFMQNGYKSSTVKDDFKSIKFEKIRKKINLSSHIIMIGCHVDPAFKLPLWEEMSAVSCAVQNIYLSLTALGLGGYWSSPSYLINNAFEFFNMTENEICMGLFYIGKPLEILPPKPVKGEVSDKVTWY